MAVRTAKLGSAIPAANTATTLFTVPAGFTYLVKSVFAFNNGGVADTIQAFTATPGGAAAVFFFQTSLASNTSVNAQNYVALAPGDIFSVYALNGTTQFWVSGTKLPGVA